MIHTIIRWELPAFLACAMGIAAFQILTGKISTRGLLLTRPNGPLSPTRVQMLFATASFALWYLNQVRLTTDFHRLPDVPTEALLAFAGSQSIYLIGKSFTTVNWQQYLKQSKN